MAGRCTTREPPTREATIGVREGGEGQLVDKFGVEAEAVSRGDGGSSKRNEEEGGAALNGRDRGREGPDTSRDSEAPSGRRPRDRGGL